MQRYITSPGRNMGADVLGNPSTAGMLIRQSVYAEFYTHVIPVNFTAAGQQLTVSKSILQDADFEWYYLNDTHNTANPFTFKFTDASTGKALMEDEIPIAAMSGTGQLPFVLPVSYIFRKNGAIIVNATNGAVAANPGSLILIGARLFEVSQ